MPKIDLSILNQKQTPAFYASSLATRPAFGFPGRIFIDTDSPSTGLYRDTGAAWVQIADPGAGTTGTLQQVTTNGNTTTNDIKLTTPAKLIVGAQYNQLYASGSLNLDLTISGDDAINFVTDNQATAQGGFLIGGGFYTNYNVGIKTNAPGASLDVHGDTNVLEQLNQTTATNNTLIAFQNSGAALWRIGNFYNTGANDWGIYDVVGAAQPLTVKKTTGQVLIGTSTVGSGKLVVASANSDNGIQIVGASAPSLRIDSAESGPTKRAGLGISTATNNFIQGSADRDFCIFNGSTAAASPILFGVYDAGAGNVQEAARISAARNFLIGTTTDSGEKLIVNGAGRFNGAVNIFDTTQATSSSSGCLILNGGLGISKNIFSSANILTNSGVIAPLNGGSIEVYAAGNSNYFDLKSSGGNFSLRTNLGVSAVNALTIASTGAATFSSVITSNGNLGFVNSNSGQAGLVADFTGGSPLKVSFSTYTDTLQCYNETAGYSIFNFTPSSKKFVVNPSGGNFLIGTTTDTGEKLIVNGAIRTASPSGGTANGWKLGSYQTNTVIFDTAHYVEVEINGVAYRLALAL